MGVGEGDAVYDYVVVQCSLHSACTVHLWLVVVVSGGMCL